MPHEGFFLEGGCRMAATFAKGDAASGDACVPKPPGSAPLPPAGMGSCSTLSSGTINGGRSPGASLGRHLVAAPLGQRSDRRVRPVDS
jgi:hypothetical protein